MFLPESRRKRLSKKKPPAQLDAQTPPKSRLQEIRDEIAQVQKQIDQLRQRYRSITNRFKLSEYEQELQKLLAKLGSLYVAENLQESADEDKSEPSTARSSFAGAGNTQKAAKSQSKPLPQPQSKPLPLPLPQSSIPQPKSKIKIKNQGKRPFVLNTIFGSVELKITYYSRNCHADKINKGVYPFLVVMGFVDNCTVNLILYIGQLSAMLSSFSEAKSVLQSQHIFLSINTIRRIVYNLSNRMRLAQKSGELDLGEPVSGKRIVVSTDGGRLRVREDQTQSQGKNGRKRTKFNTPWREPKLLIVYAVNEKGEKDQQFRTVIDGTMKGPNEIFAMIKAYLIQLKANEAKEIVFVADAAIWIWDRTEQLRAELKLGETTKFREVVDFYHATEHLGTMAGAIKSWTAKERKTWIQKQKGLLLEGKTQEFLEGIKKQGPKRSKIWLREMNFFTKHISLNRMNYGELKQSQLPIGSGGMESAVRRVINLRLKGASVYWNKASAESMLMLRSYHKANRWNCLQIQAVTEIFQAAA